MIRECGVVDPSNDMWAKTGDDHGNRDDHALWLSLHQHLLDSARIASVLWDSFWPDKTKLFIEDALGVSTARKLYVFLAGIHDVGKCSPGFQNQIRYN